MGHLDLLATGEFPSRTEYQKLLHHVCQPGKHGAATFEEICADRDRVVRKVEAEILGCCGPHADGTAGAAPPGRS
jgi:hypothetical protein